MGGKENLIFIAKLVALLDGEMGKLIKFLNPFDLTLHN